MGSGGEGRTEHKRGRPCNVGGCHVHVGPVAVLLLVANVMETGLQKKID